MAEKIELRVLKASEFDPSKSEETKGGWPKQKFHVSHLREEDFKVSGLRSYALSRDLGFIEATGGMVDGHVNRRGRPFNAEEVAHRHFHDTRFQMVYVLKGWAKMEFEGQGEITMREGSSWIQPPGIKQTVIGFSDDYEILEIFNPAKYVTFNL